MLDFCCFLLNSTDFAQILFNLHICRLIKKVFLNYKRVTKRYKTNSIRFFRQTLEGKILLKTRLTEDPYC